MDVTRRRSHMPIEQFGAGIRTSFAPEVRVNNIATEHIPH
jgi:hypothetical protein